MQAFVQQGLNDKVARKLRELSFQKFGIQAGRREQHLEGLMRALRGAHATIRCGTISTVSNGTENGTAGHVAHDLSRR